MSHPESVTAVLTANEPADGTVLIRHYDGAWTTLVRDDASAARDGHPSETWYEGGGFEARTLDDWLQPDDDIYALGEKLAAF